MSTLTATAGDDYRYPVDVWLVREGRPKYWKFHCIGCGERLAELEGRAVVMRDVIPENDNGVGVTIRCRGNGRDWCRMWYVIHLS